jgi:hypothetical protein
MHTLFPAHFILGVQSASGMNVEKNGSTRTLNREVLITNFNPPKSLLVKQRVTTTAQPSLELETDSSYQVTGSPSLVLLSSPAGHDVPASMIR